MRAFRDIRNREVFDRAMTLAAQAFTSILPILIVAGSLRGSLNPEADALFAQSLNLDDQTAKLVQESVPELTGGVTFAQVVGALLLIIAASSFARALERCFRRMWRPRASIRFAWRWVAAIVAIAIGIVLVSATRYVVRGTGAISAVEFIIEAVIWCVLWWIASWVVINRSVSLRALLPGSVLAGLGFAGAAVIGRIFLPGALASSADQFRGTRACLFVHRVAVRADGDLPHRCHRRSRHPSRRDRAPMEPLRRHSSGPHATRGPH
ncbi:MAG: YhjD/YihY/BrkB family envelope integrity protein [Microbacterium sp.]